MTARPGQAHVAGHQHRPRRRWWRDAECQGLAPTFDAPETLSRDEHARVEASRAICQQCPVTAECLEDAVQHGDSGVRGGLHLDHGKPFDQTKWRAKK